MAARRDIAQRKSALIHEVRFAISEGIWAQGDMVTPLRELARRHQLSMRVVGIELQSLINEGLLTTVPRVGTFVGHPPRANAEFYLLVTHDPERCARLQAGFDERITQLGGTSLVMARATALEYRSRDSLPFLAGVFDHSTLLEPHHEWQAAHCVRFENSLLPEDAGRCDTVSFDDRDAGRQAARHLLGLGHQKIAYLGVHARQDGPTAYPWSERREAGWLEVLRQRDSGACPLAVHPTIEPEPTHLGFRDAGRQLAAKIIARPEFTAVIAANDCIALGLIAGLREGRVPVGSWPAIVGFDALPGAQEFMLTSLRQPLEEVGRLAADILYERRMQKRVGAPENHTVPMKLIPRLTSRSNWSDLMGQKFFDASVPL